MALVKTDDVHYKAIANKVRELCGDDDMKMTPSQMPMGIEVVFVEGINFGRQQGGGDISWKEVINYRDGAYLFFKAKFTEPPLKYDDTENATEVTSLFSGCTSLLSVPKLNVKNAISFYSMYQNCSKLETIPDFDIPTEEYQTSKVNTKIFTNMFYGCTKLRTIGRLNIIDASHTTANSTSGMFQNCTNLEEVWLENICKTVTLGSGTAYCDKLTLECLIHLIKEVWSDSNVKLIIGSTNLEKLSNVYVRSIAITDEMRAEDEWIDYKTPFEVCESTDTGAMLITEYALSKKGCTIG